MSVLFHVSVQVPYVFETFITVLFHTFKACIYLVGNFVLGEMTFKWKSHATSVTYESQFLVYVDVFSSALFVEKPFPQLSQNCTSCVERWCALRSFTLVADSPQILHLNLHGLLYFFNSKLHVTSVPLTGEPVSTCGAESSVSTCSVESAISTCPGESVVSTWDDSGSTL